LTFPKERWWTRVVVWMENAGLAITRREFRVFLHPMAQILASGERHGLNLWLDRPGVFWQIMALQRTRAEARS
jgi:hypothetical protein